LILELVISAKIANHQPAGVAIGLIAISQIRSLNFSWLSRISSLESSSIDEQNVWLYWKCSLFENFSVLCIPLFI
jgi:hypothetical protein